MRKTYKSIDSSYHKVSGVYPYWLSAEVFLKLVTHASERISTKIERGLVTMKYIIAVILFVSISTINAQVTQEWVSRYHGGSGNDVASSLAIDAAGNVYVTGSSFGGAAASDYATIKCNSAGVQQWVSRYNGPTNDYDGATSIAVYGAGNVYVTGSSIGSGTDYDYATIKYDSAGIQQWVQRYNGPGNGEDGTFSLAVDSSGNVYVTGYSRSGVALGTEDYATIKYNSSGVQQWVSRYNGPGNGADYARSIAVDDSGNVYVTGYSTGSGTGSDYTTIKYNSVGIQQWVSRYNGPGNISDLAYSIAIDGSGNVYVTGSSRSGATSGTEDYAAIKYNSSGVQQWVARYNGLGNDYDGALSIAVDDSGNVYVTGQSTGSGTGADYATIKYNFAGIQRWVQRYNGSENSGDAANSIAVDDSGNVYVTGNSGSGTANDYATIKYNSAGIEQWVQRYNGPGNGSDVPHSITVDGSSNVYVTGSGPGSGTGLDYATIKYVQLPNSPSGLTALAVSSSRINLAWTDNSGTEAGFRIERRINGDTSWILKDSVSQNTISYADTGLTASKIYHYRIYAFNVAGNSSYSSVAFDTTFNLTGIISHYGELPNEYRLYGNYPNPFNPRTTIRFSLPRPGYVKLMVFNALGKEIATLVNQDLAVGTFTIQWDATGISSGIYFYRLQSGKYSETKKLALLK